MTQLGELTDMIKPQAEAWGFIISVSILGEAIR